MEIFNLLSNLEIKTTIIGDWNLVINQEEDTLNHINRNNVQATI